jgi:hypothetical protein
MTGDLTDFQTASPFAFFLKCQIKEEEMAGKIAHTGARGSVVI